MHTRCGEFFKGEPIRNLRLDCTQGIQIVRQCRCSLSLLLLVSSVARVRDLQSLVRARVFRRLFFPLVNFTNH